MTEYFTNNSRPYAENFNDGILLSDAVDLTVKASIPSMYSDESFNSNLNVERLAGVSVVTMVANTGVTVGSTSLSGTGSVTFRVYPNFSLFEKRTSSCRLRAGRLIGWGSGSLASPVTRSTVRYLYSS